MPETAPETPPETSGRGLALAACLLIAATILGGIASHSLWTPDEPTGAAVGRAMLEGGGLVLTTLNGQPFLEKPPLYWWVQVAGLRAFGFTPWAARLPSALFALLTLGLTYLAGRRLGGRRVGLLAGGVLATTALFVEDVGRVLVDPALMFFVALSHAGFALLAEARSTRERLWAARLIAVALPLAFLSKGVVTLALAAFPPVAYLLVARRGRAMRELLPVAWRAVVAFAALVVPWALALYRAGGADAVRECLLHNMTGRFLPTAAGEIYGHRQPPWYYLTNASATLLPWIAAVPGVLRCALGRRDAARPGAAARNLLLATLGLSVVLLSAAASKRELYLLPLLPALALCIALWLAATEEDVALCAACWGRPTRFVLLALAAFLSLVLGAALLAVPWVPALHQALRPAPGPQTVAPLAATGLLLLALGGAVVFQVARHRRSGALPGAPWLIGPYLVVFLLVQTGIKAWLDPLKSLDDLTAAIARDLPGGDPVPAYVPPRTSPESLFGIVGFNLGRRTERLRTPEELAGFCAARSAARLVIQIEAVAKLPPGLRGRLRYVYDETGRKASPYAIADCGEP
jgi:4-amino-4-deoxy-L-arabinose transferase-like glycosyltransferase